MTSPGGVGLSSTVEACDTDTDNCLFSFYFVTSTALHTHEGGLRPFVPFLVGILLGRFLL